MTRALARRHALRGAVGGAAVGFAATVGAAGVAAQDDDLASAGNGGAAVANANGGAISVGTINTGFNSGSAIAVGDTSAGGGGDDYDKKYDCVKDCGEEGGGGNATVAIDGGDVTNTTVIGISADGGVAAADASGGDFNVATNVDSNVFVFVS